MAPQSRGPRGAHRHSIEHRTATLIVPGTFGRDVVEILADSGPVRQPMPGFDPDYRDIVDYILKCTHRIWEQKDIGLITTHYAADCPVWTPAGPAHGVAGVIAGTTRGLAAFPDRALYGEAVIWSGNATAGYLSSHRITSTATHLGDGEFGPPCGRRLRYLTIADCLCRANLIVEEWLVRDNGHIARQLGLSLRDLAVAMPATPAARAWWEQEFARVQSSQTTVFPASALPSGVDPDDFVAWFTDTILMHRLLGRVREAYAPGGTMAAPGGRRLTGHGEIIGWWTALLACFGNARFSVDHVASQPVSDDPADGIDVAWRWTLAGTHDGPGLFGPATGRQAACLAITHWRVAAGRIQAEWTVIDEVAMLRQLLT